MSEPPRRRRPSPRRQESSSILPTIALAAGVVVLGLGIGAFISAWQHRGSEATTTTTQTLATMTPVTRPTRGPIAATAMPTPQPTATPRLIVTAPPTGTPQTTATPQPTATPEATATPQMTATPQRSAAPRETPTPRRTQTPLRTPPPTLAAAPRRPTPRPATPTPRAVATARTIAQTISETPTGFSALAQNTVRRYLSNLIAGNEAAAFADLGKMPGDPSQLSEEAFIDRGTRITTIRTTAVDGNGATVEVEMHSSRGSYFGTYHVTNGPSGPIIDQHDYIKV